MVAAAVNRTGGAFVTVLHDLDALVATDSGFLLGPWLRDARSCGRVNGNAAASAADGPAGSNESAGCVGTVVDSALKGDCAHFYEWNARVQLTNWYPAVKGELMLLRDTDYARKHWSPLIKDYYGRRAELLLEQALADAGAGRPLNADAVLAMRSELAYNFTTATVAKDPYPLTPAPGYLAVSVAMRAKYAPYFQPWCDR